MSTSIKRFLSTLLILVLPTLWTGCDVIGSGNDLEAPAAPTDLEPTSQNSAIDLDWSVVEGADSYRVYRGTSPGVTTSDNPLDADIGTAGYTDESAENGTRYYYVVTAVASAEGEDAESSASDEVESTPFSNPPDRPPMP